MKKRMTMILLLILGQCAMATERIDELSVWLGTQQANSALFSLAWKTEAWYEYLSISSDELFSAPERTLSGETNGLPIVAEGSTGTPGLWDPEIASNPLSPFSWAYDRQSMLKPFSQSITSRMQYEIDRETSFAASAPPPQPGFKAYTPGYRGGVNVFNTQFNMTQRQSYVAYSDFDAPSYSMHSRFFGGNSGGSRGWQYHEEKNSPKKNGNTQISAGYTGSILIYDDSGNTSIRWETVRTHPLALSLLLLFLVFFFGKLFSKLIRELFSAKGYG